MIGEARGSINIEVDEAMRNLDRLQGGISRFDQQSAKGMTGLSQSIVQNEQQLGAMGRTLTGVGLSLTAAFGTGLKVTADFEQGMNRVKALTGATGEQFELLKDRAIEQGAATVFSANETADAMGFLAMAGFEVQEIYDALPGTLNLAAAAQMDLGRTADIASNIMTAFKMEATEIGDVADMLTYTFTNSNTSMEQLGDAFKYVGPVAQAAGLEFAEVAAALGLLGDAGIQGSMAGTTLRGAISRLLKPTKAVQESLNKYGIATVDASGNMLGLADILDQFPPLSEGAATAMGSFQQAASDLGIDLEAAQSAGMSFEDILGEMEAAGYDTSGMMEQLGGNAELVGDLMHIFGLRAGPGMIALLSGSPDAIRELSDEIENSGGTAQRVADTQLEGFHGAIEKLTGELETLMIIAMDSGPIQALTGLVLVLEQLVGILTQLPAPVLGTIAALTGLVGILALASGAILLLLPSIARAHLAFVEFGGARGIIASLRLHLARFGALVPSVGGAMRMLAGAATFLLRALLRFALAHPILLAVTAAFYAFEHNLFGFRDALASLTAPIRNFFSTIREGFDYFRDLGQNPVSAALNSVGAALRAFDIGLLTSISDTLAGLASGIDAFFDGFGGDSETTVTANLETEIKGDDKVLEWVENPEAMDGTGFDYMVRVRTDTGELEEFGQITESYPDENDPDLYHVKITTDDGEYWTTYNDVTDTFGDAKLEVEVEADTTEARSQLDRVVDGLRAMEKQFRKMDLDFLADLTDTVADTIEGFDDLLDVFRDTWDGLRQGENAVNWFSAGLLSLNAMILAITGGDLSGWVGRIYDGIWNLAAIAQELVTNFEELRDRGLDPVQAALVAIGLTFEPLYDLMLQAAGVVRDLTGAFNAFMDGDFERGFDLLADAAEGAWGVLQEGVSLLGDLAQSVADWVLEVGVPAVTGTAQDIWDAVSSWVTDTAWPEVRDTAMEIADVAVRIGRWVRDTAPSVVEFVTSWITSLMVIAGSVAGEIDEAAVRIVQWVRDTAPSVVDFVTSWIDSLMAIAGNIAGTIQEARIDIEQWVRGSAPLVREFVVTWARHLIATVGTITEQVPEITVDILQWTRGNAPRLWTFLQTWTSEIVQTLGDLTVPITDWLVTLSDPEVTESAAEIGAMILAAVVALGIVVAAFPVVLPIALTIGAVTGLIYLGYQLAGEVARWALENPLDAVEVLANISTIVGNVEAFSIEDVKVKLRKKLGIPEGGLLQVPMDVAADITSSVEDWTGIDVPSMEDIEQWIYGLFGLDENGELRVSATAVIDWAIDFGAPDLASEDSKQMARDIWERENPDLPLPERLQPESGGVLPGLMANLAQQASTAFAGSFNIDGAIVGPLTTEASNAESTAIEAAGRIANAFSGFTGGGEEGGAGGGGGRGFGGGGGMFSGLITAAQDAVTEMQTALQTITVAITTQSSAWVTILNTTWAGPFQVTVAGTLSSVVSAFTTQTAAMTQSVLNFTVASDSSMTGWAGSFQTTVAGTLSSVVSAFEGQMAECTQSILDFTTASDGAMTGWAGAIQSTVAGTLASVVSAFRTQFQTMTTIVTVQSGAWGPIVGRAISGLAGVITSSGWGAISAAQTLGRDIGEGLARGMEQMLSRIRTAANAMVDEANRAAQSRAMAFSPSRLFMILGRDLTEGAAIGIEQMIPMIIRSGQKLVDALTRVLERVQPQDMQFGNLVDRAVALMEKTGGRAQQHLGDVLSQGEWSGDWLTRIPRELWDEARQLGREMEEALAGGTWKGKTHIDGRRVNAMDPEKVLAFVRQLESAGYAMGRMVGDWKQLGEGSVDWINTVTGEIRRWLKYPGTDFNRPPVGEGTILLSDATELGHTLQKAALDPLRDVQSSWERMLASTVPMPAFRGEGGAASGGTTTIYDQRSARIEVNGVSDPEEAAEATVEKLRREWSATKRL